jgi:hypothetical protein
MSTLYLIGVPMGTLVEYAKPILANLWIWLLGIAASFVLSI